MRDQELCFKLQEGLGDAVPCAIHYKINICCYFGKPESDVKLFLQGDSGTKKDLIISFLFAYQGGHILCQEDQEKILEGT